MLCREVIMIESGRIVFSDTMDAFNNYMQPNSLLVQFRNPPQIADLKQVKGVQKVEYLTDKQARIFFDGDPDISENLILASVQKEWSIREINLEKGMLDDIFKQLSSQPLQ
jgi:ABC-2 type transport system ATP-binding protein